MPVLLKKFLLSRKFYAFVAGLATAVSASLQDGVFQQNEIQTIVLLVIGYIFSVAFEDGMSNRVNWNSVNWNSVAPDDSTMVVTTEPSNVTIETVETVKEEKTF